MCVENKVNCQSPVLILSTKAFEYALNCDFYFVDGHKFPINAHQKSDILSGEKISKVLGLPYVQQITKKDGWTDAQFNLARHRFDNFLNDSFFLSNSGECFPIWEFVPCGHCDACLNKKLTSYLTKGFKKPRPRLALTERKLSDLTKASLKAYLRTYETTLPPSISSQFGNPYCLAS